MWPFGRKPKTVAGQSFQEFRRTHQAPTPPPVVDPIEVQTLCTICACIFPPGTIARAYPFCNDCSSEGMEIEVELLSDFLGRHSVDDLDAMLKRWESADGYLAEYKKLKSERLRQLKSLKLTFR